jgi:hypothetical protein
MIGRVKMIALAAALFQAATAFPVPDAALAADAIRRCREKRLDDTVRQVPPSLAGRAAKALQVGISDIVEHPERYVYRCMNGVLLVCDHGANITCAKGDVRKRMQSVDDFCKSNPNEFVPMAVTGHGAIYSWECRKGRPVITTTQRVDERGFIADHWRSLE